jgi:N utilization substance protein A
MQTPRTEFAQALKAIANERGLDPAVILDTIKQAIIAAYRRDAKERGEDTETMDFDVEINPVNGEAKVFSWPLASEDATDEEKDKAKEERKDVTPPGFGRIAAQTAKQVIHQKIREAEKGAIMDEFSVRVGTLISGMVLRFDGPNVRVDIGRTEALMPAEERISSERLNLNQRCTFLLKAIEETPKGKELILSRSDPAFVEKLFAREVPEVSSGSVMIKTIAREPGVRTKIAVISSQSGVDPVGSCVGQKGVRVQAVTNELGGERVDIIPWSEDPAELIKGSLAPAENLEVEINEEQKLAVVKAPEDQLSLAIGKEGQNVRLTAKLTGYRIEVEGVPVVEQKEEKEEEKEEKKEKPKKAKKEPKTKKEKKEEEPKKVEEVKEEKVEETEETKVEEAPVEVQPEEVKPAEEPVTETPVEETKEEVVTPEEPEVKEESPKEAN